MCLVTKGEKLLVEKDITLEDFITIKVTPVRIHHLVPGQAEGGNQRLGGGVGVGGCFWLWLQLSRVGEMAWMQGDG